MIFVPGNAGSYKQSRSFASVALRKGLELNWQKHLDYFTGRIEAVSVAVSILIEHFNR